jgi:hypothetical protein
MTTAKQFAANRENGKKSTGPKTEAGKLRSRRNAFRHGLTAETVIEILEDRAGYKALASRIHADYRPASNFELELVARLVSLLWRLRRATAIESGLFNIQAQASRRPAKSARQKQDKLHAFYALIPALTPRAQGSYEQPPAEVDDGSTGAGKRASQSITPDIARAFMRVSSDGDVFERLGRYEVRLWRQTVQTILLLNSIRHDNKEYLDFDDKYVHFGNRRAKYRRVSWPPFVPSN